MTYRAVEVLKSVGMIACEDTRHTRKLLTHLGISNKLVSYHEHNEAERSEQLVKDLQKEFGRDRLGCRDAGNLRSRDFACRASDRNRSRSRLDTRCRRIRKCVGRFRTPDGLDFLRRVSPIEEERTTKTY